MGATGVGFLLIGLLDTLLRFNGGVSFLRGIGERPLVGPFLYISDTILNTSSIFFNFSSNIFSFFVTLYSGSPFSLFITFIIIDATQQLASYVLYFFIGFTPCLLFLYHWVYLVILGAAQRLTSYVFYFFIWFTTCLSLFL